MLKKMKKLTQKEVEERLIEKGIELISNYEGCRKIHKLKCRCGNVFNSAPKDFIFGHNVSCGCEKKYSEEEIKNICLEKNLILIDTEIYSNKPIKIRCFCGNEFSTKFRLIKNGKTKSCGCLNLKRGKSNFHWDGFEEISGTYISVIRKHAIMKNREFNISSEYLWNLFIHQNKKCALSGVDISFSRPSKQSRQTASLDRIDSSRGYVEENVQWVHKRINLMKRNDSDKEFYNWINTIYNFKMKGKL